MVEPASSDVRHPQRRLLDMIDALVRDIHAAPLATGGATPDSRLEADLGLDSIAKAELLLRVEQAFGVKLPLETFAGSTTPADIMRALQHAGASDTRAEAGGRTSDSDALRVSSEHYVDGDGYGTGTSQDPGLPHDARTLVDALRWHVDRHAQRVHSVILREDLPVQTLSYGALYRNAMRSAFGLRALGVDPGDTVALMLPTGSDYFSSFLGVMLCGAIPVPLYPPAQAAQIAEHFQRHAKILENAQVTTLIVDARVVTFGQLLHASVPSLRRIVKPAQMSAPAVGEIYRPRPDDVAFLQYTSGSTGDPKGVVLSHANVIANLRAMGEAAHVDGNDVLVSWLPLYHDMGLIGAWFAPLYWGFPLVVMSPLTFLARPLRWLEAIQTYRGTITAAPNFAYERCVRIPPDSQPAALNLTSLRLAFNGAEPVHAETMRRFAARFAADGLDAHALTPVYGLAENAVGLAFPEPGRGLTTERICRDRFADAHQAVPAAAGDADALEVVSCGRALPGHQIRIVDDDGASLPPRHIGKIEFRGPSATRGYYRNPAQSGKLFDDGWLDTGDIGFLAENEIYVTGRAKDMIIRAGRHFYPYELETQAGRVPGVRNGCVAVCGAQDPVAGTERLVVFAETRAHDTAVRERIRMAIQTAAVTLFGGPAEEIVLLPPHGVLKTSSGKIRRNATLARWQHTGEMPQQPGWRQRIEIVARTLGPAARRGVRRAAMVAYGLYCWALFAAIAPGVWTVVALQRDRRHSWALAARASRLFIALAGIRLDVRGLEHLDPPQSSVTSRPSTSEHSEHAAPLSTDHRQIAVVNHSSYLDGLVMLAALPYPMSMVAKRELAGQFFAGRFLSRIGTRFVERFDTRRSLDDQTTLMQCAAANERLLFFPEGTFVRAAGLRAFHLGAFVAACTARCAVVPIAIAGTRAILRDGTWLPTRGAITVTVMPALEPPGTDLHSAAALRDAARNAIAPATGEPCVDAVAPLEPLHTAAP